jgi:hypothetical protein
VLTPDQESVSADVLWLLTGDACQRALIAWHMGWNPAKEASGEDWLPIYLSHLLDDPYACVRFISFRSLRQLPGFQDFVYDFVGTAADRKAAVPRAASQWMSASSGDFDRYGEAVLLDASGAVDELRFAQLARARDDKIVDLRE